jgi:hypothetical protein
MIKRVAKQSSAGQANVVEGGAHTNAGRLATAPRTNGISAVQPAAIRLESKLSGRYVREGARFDVVVVKRSTKRPGIRDFAITLL